MKQIFLLLIAFLCFTAINAQKNSDYETKTKVYKDILESLLSIGDLDRFDAEMNQIDIERKTKVFSSDRKSYSIETVFPDNEKMITAYLYPSGKVVRLIFLHQTDVYSFIRGYLDKNTAYKQEYGMWLDHKNKLMFQYEIDGVVAVLNVYRTDYEY